MRYFRRRWDEDRGDEFARWGRSTWLFETSDDLVARRQIEIYDAGVRLRYDDLAWEDRYGQLAIGRVFAEDEDESTREISAADFEAEWDAVPSHHPDRLFP